MPAERSSSKSSSAIANQSRTARLRGHIQHDAHSSLHSAAFAEKRNHFTFVLLERKPERRLAVLHLRIDVRSVFKQQAGEFEIAVERSFVQRCEPTVGLHRIDVRTVSD